MWWLDDIIVPMLLIAGICSFVLMVRFRVGMLTRETTRTAEGMYPAYADSRRKQRKYAREHGAQWHDAEDRQGALTRPVTPPREPPEPPAGPVPGSRP